MNSIERPGDAKVEGFAHFFAARVFNSQTNLAPKFVYYKEVLVPQCSPGQPCGSQKVLPPFPVDVAAPALWRNRYCSGAPFPQNPPPDSATFGGLPIFGTELDYLNFYWNLNLPKANHFAFEEILRIDREAPSEHDTGGRVARGSRWSEALAAVRKIHGINTDKSLPFEQFGDDYGINENLTRR